MKPSCILFPLLLFICTFHLSSGLQLKSAGYQVRETNFLGNTYRYALFEAEYDEEIGFLRQWSCPCVNSSISCSSDSSDVAPTVDESGYDIIDLEQGVWYNDTILTNYEKRYFKFNLAYNPSTPCPVVHFELQTQVGSMSAYISSQEIPSQDSFAWYRPYYSFSSYSICPSHPDFAYGNYYVLMVNEASYQTNVYAIRFDVSQSPTCPLLPQSDYKSVPDPIMNDYPDAVEPTWLDDGVAFRGDASSVPDASYIYFKLYSEGRCSNISVSIYRDSIGSEPDLFVSTTNPNPSQEDSESYQWHCTMDADDFINAYSCNPDENSQHQIFYIAVRSWPLNSFVLVATTQQYQPPIALSSLALSQYRFDLSVGAFPSLICDTEAISPSSGQLNRLSTAYSCEFVAYISCEFDAYDCCRLFGQVAPVKSPQPLWPWSEADTSIGTFYTAIPWSDFEPLQPGKLSWYLYMGWSDTESNTTYSLADPSTCKVIVNNQVMGMSGSRMPFDPTTLASEPITFTKKKTSCNLDALQAVDTKIEDITNTMAEINSRVDILALQQLRTAILSWDEALTGCENNVYRLSTAPQVSETLNFTNCLNIEGTEQWLSDPCCNPELFRTTSCRPTEVRFVLPWVDTSRMQANNALVKSQCRNSECSFKTVETFLDISAKIADQTTGCSAAFEKNADLENLADLLNFVEECKVSISGPDLNGAPCSTDQDCFYGAECNIYTKKCNQTQSDVIQCLAEKIDPVTARILFNRWQISERVNESRLIEEFTRRFIKDQCVGPTALNYREGYTYGVQISGCTDECLLTGIEPYCTDISLGTRFCPIPDNCDGANGFCYRIWKPLVNDETGCLDSKICNWRNSTFVPCPFGADPTECQQNCLDSPTPNVCLDCSQTLNGQCLEVEFIDSASRCALGLCSSDPSVTDPATCASIGVCSITCPGCNDESGCTSNGVCSDEAEFTDFKQAFGLTNGACIYPIIWDITNGSYCMTDDDLLSSIGCANASVIDQVTCLTNPGSFWYEFATSEQTCTDNAGNGCYDYNKEEWLPRNESECLICGESCSWEPFYSWSSGEWKNGSIQALLWEPRRYYAANSYEPSVDYSNLNSEVGAAITETFSLSYQTEALCRFGTTNELIASAACDCTPQSNGGSCFSKITDTKIGVGKACPFLQTSFETLSSSIEISDSVVPPGLPCQTVSLQQTSSNQYQIPENQGVSQALFRGTPTNEYWIVKNKKSAFIGQIVSDAIKVSYDFIQADQLRMCLIIDSGIEIAKVAKIFTFAQLDESDNSVRAFASTIPIDVVDNSKICAAISEPGTYFAVKVVADYEEQDPRLGLVQYRVGAALYGCIIVFAIIQAIFLTLDRVRQKIYTMKMIFVAIVTVNAIVRMVYVLLPPTAFGKGMDSIQFIIFELPTFFYFSIFTAIAYLWLVVVLKTYHLGKKAAVRSSEQKLRKAFILANCGMYLVFVLFIFLIAIVPELQKKSPCFYGQLDTSSNSASYRIKLAYWIFQAVISVVVCSTFAIGAILLLRVVLEIRSNQQKRKGNESRSHPKNRQADKQMVIISVVAAVCAIFLLIRSAIFLWAAKTGNALNVIVFVLLECIPQFMLLFYVHPFRCFREEGVSSSSRSGGSTDKQRSRFSSWYSRGASSYALSTSNLKKKSTTAESLSAAKESIS